MEDLKALVQAMFVSAHASAGIKLHTLIVAGSHPATIKVWFVKQLRNKIRKATENLVEDLEGLDGRGVDLKLIRSKVKLTFGVDLKSS